MSPGVAADRGTVQKVIVLPRDDLLTEELVLEEVEVFRVSLRLLVLTARGQHEINKTISRELM